MNTYFKALALALLTTLAFSCKKDDDGSVSLRDYTEQYATEKIDIEEYLHTHYIVSVDAEYNVVLDTLTDPATQVSIWDQTDYPLQSKEINSLDEDNAPLYTLYYIMFNQGEGDQPTRADNVVVSYRGTTLEGVQFDYAPYPSASFSLASTIEGWQEIIPLFKSGSYIDNPGSPDPATYQGYGAGMMFIPSGMGYFNQTSTNLPSYSSMIFSFKLYSVYYIDSDGDGLLNRYETDGVTDIARYDTDGDGTANYLDTDDDDDGYLTTAEIRIPGTDPVEYYDFENIPTCSSGVKRHLDASCHQ